MPSVSGWASAVVVIALVVAVAVALRPRWVQGPGRRWLAVLALGGLPALAVALGAAHHLEAAKTTDFCLSCHEMEPYGQSLWIDDSDYLPANHFQNRRVDRQAACFDCHTDYTMFGDLQAKIRGLRHVWVHYAGTIPEEIQLYSPYRNRECLHCHAGARAFEEAEDHVDFLEELRSEETSCLECHDLVHGLAELDGLERWSGAEEEGE